LGGYNLANREKNMKYQVYQIDAFTNQRFTGNPAGVVSNADGLTDSQMQAIARELNNSETAFILSPTASDHEVWIRFFTPTIEVPVCGHATISAHYVRAIERKLPSCTVMQKIGIGILPVEIIKQDNDYKVVMTQGKVEFSSPLAETERGEIITALGLSESNLDHRCPIQIVSTGHSKVLIGINNLGILNSLKPDLTSLARLSERIKCNGYFVFTIDPESKDILTHGRMFAPAIGIPEDPVTGNANGPLGAYIIKYELMELKNGTLKYRAKQGEAIGREGIVEVEVEVRNGDPVQVKVGGNAIIVFKTYFEI
jgi:PhzF family phenazine biosynthesis protein